MIVMATSCVTKSSHKYYHLANYLEEPLKRLVGLQRSDGSFGPNLDSTVLAYQALHQADHLHLAVNRSAPLAPSWKKQGALDWLRNSHHLDGSFGDLLTTSKVVLALSHRGFPSLHDNECRRPSKIVEPVQPSIPDATTPPNVNGRISDRIVCSLYPPLNINGNGLSAYRTHCKSFMDQMNPFIFFPARVFQINQINLSNTLKNIGRDGILLWKISKTIVAIKGVLAIKISLITLKKKWSVKRIRGYCFRKRFRPFGYNFSSYNNDHSNHFIVRQ